MRAVFGLIPDLESDSSPPQCVESLAGKAKTLANSFAGHGRAGNPPGMHKPGSKVIAGEDCVDIWWLSKRGPGSCYERCSPSLAMTV